MDHDSSHIASSTYDPATRQLTLQFTNGRTYQYAGLEPEMYTALCAAPSTGKFFAQYIRGRFPHQEQRDAEQGQEQSPVPPAARGRLGRPDGQ